jgi:hypothetical protein
VRVKRFQAIHYCGVGTTRGLALCGYGASADDLRRCCTEAVPETIVMAIVKAITVMVRFAMLESTGPLKVRLGPRAMPEPLNPRSRADI